MAEERSTINRRLQSKSEKPDNQEQCPRCESFNTKFCYYNNYSLSQPRFFCKGCRRYWTRGGTLRNVPVGGGCRKGKRATTKPSSTAPTEGSLHPPSPLQISNPSAHSNQQSLLLQPMLASYCSGAGLIPGPESSVCPSRLGGSYSHLNLLRGLDIFPSYSSMGRTHHHHHQHDMIFETSVLCPTDHRRALQSRPITYDWNQSFNSSTLPVINDGNFWTGNQNTAASSSLDPSTTHWSHGLQ